MPIRHMALFSFRDDADPAAVEDLIARLNRLPDLIPGIREWGVHDDLGGRPGSLRWALVARFDSMGDVNAYLEHPEHVAVVDDVAPLLASLAEHDHEVGG